MALWRNDPFKPHLIARLRTTAYQKTVVMKYIDNLIAWGDQLFRRDTHRVDQRGDAALRPGRGDPRAAGPRRAAAGRARACRPTTRSSRSLDELRQRAGRRSRSFIAPSAGGDVAATTACASLTLPLAMLYFCVPQNDKLLGYWDTVADRLFKIRHCMNIEGVVRQLPLFEPPIDPALLVQAAAAGVDIGSVLNDVSAALPHYRFNVLAQKATELCAEVKSLGAGAALGAREAGRRSARRSCGRSTRRRCSALVERVKSRQCEEAEQNASDPRRRARCRP